jgi:hypothetical protein
MDSFLPAKIRQFQDKKSPAECEAPTGRDMEKTMKSYQTRPLARTSRVLAPPKAVQLDLFEPVPIPNRLVQVSANHQAVLDYFAERCRPPAYWCADPASMIGEILGLPALEVSRCRRDLIAKGLLFRQRNAGGPPYIALSEWPILGRVSAESLRQNVAELAGEFQALIFRAGQIASALEAIGEVDQGSRMAGIAADARRAVAQILPSRAEDPR